MVVELEDTSIQAAILAIVGRSRRLLDQTTGKPSHHLEMVQSCSLLKVVVVSFIEVLIPD